MATGAVTRWLTYSELAKDCNREMSKLLWHSHDSLRNGQKRCPGHLRKAALYGCRELFSSSVPLKRPQRKRPATQTPTAKLPKEKMPTENSPTEKIPIENRPAE
jgi:hypothetical protein